MTVHHLIANWKTETIVGVKWCVSPGVSWCAAGSRVRIGYRASIGDGASIGDRASIGDGARIGYRATAIADLGSYEGYRKVLCALNGVAYVGAGCRWFTLGAAIAHWKSKRRERPITYAMVSEVATKIARQHKLKCR